MKNNLIFTNLAEQPTEDVEILSALSKRLLTPWQLDSHSVTLTCLRIQDKVGKYQYITNSNQQRDPRASGIRYRFTMPLHEKQSHFYKFSRTTNRRCGDKATHIYI
jgi:hypothetical protein